MLTRPVISLICSQSGLRRSTTVHRQRPNCVSSHLLLPADPAVEFEEASTGAEFRCGVHPDEAARALMEGDYYAYGQTSKSPFSARIPNNPRCPTLPRFTRLLSFASPGLQCRASRRAAIDQDRAVVRLLPAHCSRVPGRQCRYCKNSQEVGGLWGGVDCAGSQALTRRSARLRSHCLLEACTS